MGKLRNNISDAFRRVRPYLYRVRGFVEYGPLRALKSYKQARTNKATPEHKLAICAIAKNEGPFFAEWIEYHNMMGVEKFYIYDNESDDNIKEVLKPYIDSGLVDYKFIAGKKLQRVAYADCLQQHRFDSEWIAFIDLDEFIVPIKHANIQDFLSEYTDYSVVQINWVCYGSGGQKTKRPGLVMERFRDHSELDYSLNRHIKSIVQPSRVLNFSGAHECVRLYGRTVNVNKEKVTKYHKSMPPCGQDIIRINHYTIKSYEEYQGKSRRGRAHHGRDLNDDFFQLYDRNEIKDDPIMEKYVPLVKERLKKTNG